MAKGNGNGEEGEREKGRGKREMGKGIGGKGIGGQKMGGGQLLKTFVSFLKLPSIECPFDQQFRQIAGSHHSSISHSLRQQKVIILSTAQIENF